jgi:hypothetical protein
MTIDFTIQKKYDTKHYNANPSIRSRIPPTITAIPVTVIFPEMGTSGVGTTLVGVGDKSQAQFVFSVHKGFRQYPLIQVRVDGQSLDVVQLLLHFGCGVLVGVGDTSQTQLVFNKHD